MCCDDTYDCEDEFPCVLLIYVVNLHRYSFFASFSLLQMRIIVLQFFGVSIQFSLLIYSLLLIINYYRVILIIIDDSCRWCTRY